MNKHTPEPWKWLEDTWWGGYSCLVGPNDETVLAADHCNDGDDGAAWFDEYPSEADRLLIQASPDLFKACDYPGDDYGLLLRLAADIIEDRGHERHQGIAKRLREKAKLEKTAIIKATATRN